MPEAQQPSAAEIEARFATTLCAIYNLILELKAAKGGKGKRWVLTSDAIDRYAKTRERLSIVMNPNDVVFEIIDPVKDDAPKSQLWKPGDPW